MPHKKGITFIMLVASYVYVTTLVPIWAQEKGGGAASQLPAGVQQSKLPSGTMILTDAKGMTLYTFMKDTEGKSNCNGQCEKNWPPLTAAADAKPTRDWTIVTRDDGSKQWAYKGKPLYTWAKDAKPGDTTGDGVGNGAWKMATP